MAMIFFANDSTYSGSTVNVGASYQSANPGTSISNHVRAFFILKALLKTCGWAVSSSADGVSTYSANSDILTMGTSSNGVNTVGDFYNGSAWFYIQSPGTSSQHITIQRTAGTYANNGHGWRIKYSTTGFFTSGMAGSTGLTGSITATPTAISASNEILIAGGGTDAAPSFTGFNPIVNAGTRAHMGANNAAPYGFWFSLMQIGSNPGANLGYYFVNDPLLSGSYPGTGQSVPDASPYVTGIFTTLALFANPTQQFSMAGTFLKREGVLTDETLQPPSIVRWGALHYNATDDSTRVCPGGGSINAATMKIDLLPIWYARQKTNGGPGGIKGVSSLMYFPLFQPSVNEVFSHVTQRDRVSIGYIVFDWDGISEITP